MSAYDTETGAQAAALLEDFGRYLGIADLALDADGNCRLSFDDHIIDLDYDDGRDDFLITADVGDILSPEDAFLLRRLLELSLAGGLQGVGSLGLDGERRRMIWFDRIAVAGKTQQRFQDEIGRSLKNIDYWKTTILQQRTMSAAPKVGGLDMSDHVLIRA